MSFRHAVLLIDHHHAKILLFTASHVETQKFKAHSHHTRQHGSEARTEHEFFAQVCNALPSDAELLVAGGYLAQVDFRHYIDKHHPSVAPQIKAWEMVDHPSDGQLLALAKKHFLKLDKMSGDAPLH